MAFYPSIRDELIMTLNVVIGNMEVDPRYLSSPECPYSDTVKTFFADHMRGKNGTVAAVVGNLFEDSDELVVLDTQIIQVLNNLEEFGQGLTSADVSEKMAYFRTKTSLLEKLLTMRERVVNLKEINDFRETLIGFMNEICTKDQITDLMHRLDGILGTKSDDLS